MFLGTDSEDVLQRGISKIVWELGSIKKTSNKDRGENVIHLTNCFENQTHLFVSKFCIMNGVFDKFSFHWVN